MSQASRFTVVQAPNPPLLVAGTAWLTSLFTSGPLHTTARAAFFAFIFVWAYEEIRQGVNVFRRLLGAVVFIGCLLSLIHELR